jgi:hypothetical protein
VIYGNAVRVIRLETARESSPAGRYQEPWLWWQEMSSVRRLVFVVIVTVVVAMVVYGGISTIDSFFAVPSANDLSPR